MQEGENSRFEIEDLRTDGKGKEPEGKMKKEKCEKIRKNDKKEPEYIDK